VFFRAEDGIRDRNVTGVQTCALPILSDWQDAGNGLHNTNSGFSYTAGDDGIDLTLEHALEEETDKFPDGTNGTTKSSLPQQVGRSEERRVGKECSWRRSRGGGWQGGV